MESELSGIFPVKLVTKNIVRGSPGTQFMHMRVKSNFFCFESIQQVNTSYKMNEIVNNILLAGDTFMLEMLLRLPGFTDSACGAFTKNKE